MKTYIYDCKDKELFLKTTDIMFPEIPKENIMIYDIDTTSFEAANGCLFLIGTACYENDHLVIRQYFSESISEEAEIIKAFLNLSDKYSVFLSYKGESFDIPFIGKRLYSLGMGEYYNKLQIVRSHSFDLFNEIHPLKSGLDFNSTKLDSLRQKFGQNVPERIDGENICRFYVEFIAANRLRSLLSISCLPENSGFITDYIPTDEADELPHITPDQGDRFLKSILLRNQENMSAVLYLLRLSHIFVIRRGAFKAEISADTQFSSKAESSSDTLILSSETGKLKLHIAERDFKMDITLNSFNLELKQFFPNFKDYYYFPDQDMAMHRSVAEFASPSSRKKATSKTAYRKVNGSFIHIPKSYAVSDTGKNSPRYKKSYESEEYFLPLIEALRLNPDFLKELAYYIILETGSADLSSLLIPIPDPGSFTEMNDPVPDQIS